MTSGAKKEKARKKRREQKLLQEQQQRVDEEKAQRVPVSTPVSLPTPVGEPPLLRPYGNRPDSDEYHEPIPSSRDTSRMPSPPPSPYEDMPDIPIHTRVGPSVAYYSTPNHRLRPQRQPFPRSLPKRLPIPQSSPPSTPLAPIHALTIHSGPFDHPLPVLELPRAMPLPNEPSTLFHLQRDPPYRALPADTAYGTAQSVLAAACAEQHPWIYFARGRIGEIAWGHNDEREDYLGHLPCDQLIFLATITQMLELEPDLALFFESAITDFANAWVDHCDGLG
ncbi:hypothetical protein DFH09DRAFT_1309100 [Mycena vulgaris]|nr:hypothetical protein DFH09DRAFT_1309100 [Mycena vulgaris]